MTLTERLEWLFVGAVIGFILGYTVRAFREIRTSPTDRNDDGFMRFPIVQDVAIVLALGLTLFASFAAARLNDQLKHVVECNKVYLQKNLVADTTRTNYLRVRLKANAQLQENQAKFLKSLLKEPGSNDSLVQYIHSLDRFLRVTKNEQRLTPYPTVEDLQNCLDN